MKFAEFDKLANYYAKKKKREKEKLTKSVVGELLEKEFKLEILDRNLFAHKDFKIRVASINSDSQQLSNTIKSFDSIIKYDDLPIILMIVSPNQIYYRLANLTFIKKVSHSSKLLEVSNIKGSINGSDIMSEFNGLENSKENFDKLFSMHLLENKKENIERIVRETHDIKASVSTGKKISVSLKDFEKYIKTENKLLTSKEFSIIEDTDRKKILNLSKEIIEVFETVDNVNLQGNTIEQLITGSGNTHGIEDTIYESVYGKIKIDYKTKNLNKKSSPKAVDINKLVETIAEGSRFLFQLVEYNPENKEISTCLFSPFEEYVINNSLVQHHWSGRGSLGHIQFNNKVKGRNIYENRREINIEVIRKSKVYSSMKLSK